MFDRYYGHTRTEHVPYVKEVKVQEHRAPTDQSIQLLNDMHEKAMDNIVAQLKMSGSTSITELHALVDYDVKFREVVLRYKFRINGKDIFGCIEYPDHIPGSLNQNDIEKMVNLLIGDMSKRIAEYFADHIVRASVIRHGESVEFDLG